MLYNVVSAAGKKILGFWGPIYHRKTYSEGKIEQIIQDQTNSAKRSIESLKILGGKKPPESWGGKKQSAESWGVKTPHTPQGWGVKTTLYI